MPGAGLQCIERDRLFGADNGLRQAHRITRDNDTSRSFSIRQINSFVFRIETEDGNTATINAERNFDPATNSYYLEVGAIAGFVCQAPRDASVCQKVRGWLIKKIDKDGAAPSGIKTKSPRL